MYEVSSRGGRESRQVADEQREREERETGETLKSPRGVDSREGSNEEWM